MLTIEQQKAVVRAVKARVKELESGLVNKYLDAVTPWLIRNVLECTEQLNTADVTHSDDAGQCVCPAGVGICGFGNPDTNECNYHQLNSKIKLI